jgi:hypothetical protein
MHVPQAGRIPVGHRIIIAALLRYSLPRSSGTPYSAPSGQAEWPNSMSSKYGPESEARQRADMVRMSLVSPLWLPTSVASREFPVTQFSLSWPGQLMKFCCESSTTWISPNRRAG